MEEVNLLVFVEVVPRGKRNEQVEALSKGF